MSGQVWQSVPELCIHPHRQHRDILKSVSLPNSCSAHSEHQYTPDPLRSLSQVKDPASRTFPLMTDRPFLCTVSPLQVPEHVLFPGRMSQWSPPADPQITWKL